MLRILKFIPEFIDAIYYSWKSRQLFCYLKFLILIVLFKKNRKQIPQELSDLSVHTVPVEVRLLNQHAINNYTFKTQSISVNLAGVEHQLVTDNLWNISYQDNEELFALHRFGWLLVAISEEQLTDSVAQFTVLDWLKNYGICRDGVGWDSYSISERVSNWVVYLNNVKANDSDLKLIKSSIQLQLSYLITHLEFRGMATNNHLINNARALYLGGFFIGNTYFKREGKKILQRCVKYMFSRSGFLREGSSHYQILLARSFLEVYYFAQKDKDGEFTKEILLPVKNIWQAACFFLQESKLPQFGDISPDFTPEFHYGVAEFGAYLMQNITAESISEGNGWHTILFDTKYYYDKRPNGLLYYEDAGYFCFKNSNFALYTFVNPENCVSAWSHGHSDAGHIILYAKGFPILIGTGRVNYTNDIESMYGRSICSHNSIEVDGREPMVVHGLNFFPELLPDGYVEGHSELNFSRISEGECEIVIKQYGYNRIDSTISIERRIFVGLTQIVITDNILGKGEHQLRTFFHFDQDVLLEKKSRKKMLVNIANINLFLTGNCIEFMQRDTAYSSMCYGSSVKVPRLTYEQQTKLPVENQYSFTLVN